MDIANVTAAVPSTSPCSPISVARPVSRGHVVVAGSAAGHGLGAQYAGGGWSAVVADVRPGTDKPGLVAELVRERGHAPVAMTTMTAGFDAIPVQDSRLRAPM